MGNLMAPGAQTPAPPPRVPPPPPPTGYLAETAQPGTPSRDHPPPGCAAPRVENSKSTKHGDPGGPRRPLSFQGTVYLPI